MPDPAAAATATPASTSFDLLGPLVVTVAGTAVRLGGPRQVAVLARLLLSPGQVVSMEQLAESVWDGDLPARPEVAIRSYISNLRRSIEPDRHPGDRQSCLESIPPGYRMAVDPGALDAHRFEQLVGQGRAALTRDDPAAAATHLAGALRLWRGEPCEGLVDTDALMAYRSRLAELRLVALEQWFEARLGLGEHESLVPDLESVLADHPRRERLTEVVMVALYRAGRQSEALAACRRLRIQLVDQLGIDPGPRVQALEHKILTHDPSLLADGRPVAPPPVATPTTVPVTGAAATTTTEDVGPSHDSGVVFGRTRELAILAGLEVALDQGRSASVVITGEPGSGKSTLLGKVAERGQSAGVVVAWGRCREVARAQLLWPWTQILHHLATLDHAPGDEWAELARAGLVAPLLTGDGASGGGARLSPPRDPGEATALFPTIVRLLRRLAAVRPILIVIDDAHWADEASAELLAFAGPGLEADRVAFAVAWRHTEVDPSPTRRALRDLARLPGLQRIELAGIPVQAVAELATALRPDAPEAVGLASALHRVTAGNPFLVREMLAAMAATPPDGGAGPAEAWPDDEDEQVAALLAPAPPTNVQEQILLRAERAHPAAPAVLTVTALSPTPVTAELVAEAAELALDDVESALERSVQAGLLIDDSPRERTYRFAHPVAARALAATLSGPRLSRLHAALGHARWRSGAEPARLVYHFARARSAGTSLLAARFALLALQTSSALDLIDEAGALAEANLDALTGLAGAEGLALDLALLDAQVARLRGDRDRQRRSAGRAVELAARAVEVAGPGADPSTAPTALVPLAVLAGTGPHPAGPAFAVVAWDGAPGDDTWSRHPVAAALDAGTGPAPEWMALAVRRARLEGRAAGLFEAAAGPPAAGHGAGGHGAAGSGPAAGMAVWRERALAAFELAGRGEQAAVAAEVTGGDVGPPIPVGPHDVLLAQRLTLVATGHRPGDDPTDDERFDGVGSQPTPRSVLELDRALTEVTVDLVRGRLVRAADRVDQLARWNARYRLAPGVVQWQRCLVLWEQGRPAELEQVAAAGGDGLLAWRAVGAAEAGDQAGAAALLRRALALSTAGEAHREVHSEVDLETPVDLRRPPVPATGGRWNRAERCLLVLAAHRAGDRLAADHFSRTLEARGPAVASTASGLAVVGPVAWFRALGAMTAGDLAGAEGLLERADEQARHHDAPTWRIRALAGRAEAALAGHDHDRAERCLAEAAALAADGGSGWFDRWLLQSTSNRFATR